MTFAGLLYTDARSSESASRKEGFQFQAVSSNATAEMQPEAMRVLYQVPTGMAQQERPPQEFPQSFAYRKAQQFHVVSRGRYLGKIADGRPGNHATHCLVTAQPFDLQPHRPAQLFGTEVWATNKAASTTLDEVQSPLVLSDSRFELPALQELAKSAPERVVEELVEMVRASIADPRRRLVVVAEQLDIFMQWIALATLFLDKEDALRVGIRAFSTRPLEDSDFEVVATNEAVLGRPFHISTELGVNVIDLQSFERTEATVSPVLLELADWFRSEDPYDAIEAIELVGRWSGLEDTSTVHSAVSSLTFHDSPASSAACAKLLAAIAEKRPSELEDYSDELLDQIHVFGGQAGNECGPVLSTTSRLSAAGFGSLASSTLLAALEMAAVDSQAASTLLAWIDSDSLPRLVEDDWEHEDARTHAAGLFQEAFRDASPSEFPRILSAIPRLALPLNGDAAVNLASGAAKLLSNNPSRIAETDSWAASSLVVEHVSNMLAERLAGPNRTEAAIEIWDGYWIELWRRVAPSVDEPLAAWYEGQRVRPGARVSEASLNDFKKSIMRVDDTPWQSYFDPRRLPGARRMKCWIEAGKEIDQSFWVAIEEMVQRVHSSGGSELPAVNQLLMALSRSKIPAENSFLQEATTGTATFISTYNRILDHAAEVPNLSIQGLAELDPTSLILQERLVADLFLRCADKRGIYSALESLRLERQLPDGVHQRAKHLIGKNPISGISHCVDAWSTLILPLEVRQAAGIAVNEWWRDPSRTKEERRALTAEMDPVCCTQIERLLKKKGKAGERTARGSAKPKRLGRGRDRG